MRSTTLATGGGRWSTGRRAGSPPHPLQLAIYRLAWARLAGVDVTAVRATFLYVRTGEAVSHEDLDGEDDLIALLSGGPAPPPEALTLL